MSYEPLHHKYRPQTFAQLVGQDAIATTLSNALTSAKIAPAYLFTGPRGTGKTSSARILAKSLNCLTSGQPTPAPCGTCEVCKAIAKGSALDVIEIDAASNTGVDNIREIIERAQFAPVQCRYKVYVIDECHMLSVAAFNALLKTLEEPPKHVVFVLATTDPQRVLPTIISRCQRFDYRRIPLESMVKHLSEIAQIESINIEPEAITLIAQIANGGLRDAESLLDQLSLLVGTITSEKVWDLVGAVPEKDLLELIQSIHSNQAENVLNKCRHLMNRGREPLVVLQNLAGFYLNLLIAKTAPNRPDMVAVTAPTWQQLCQEAQQWQIDEILRGQQHLKDSEIQIKNTTQPRLWLEVTLLGLLPSAKPNTTVIVQATNTPTTNNNTNTNNNQNTSFNQAEFKPTIQAESLHPQPQSSINEPPNKENQEVTNSTNINEQELWQQIISQIQPPSTKALLSQHCHLISFDYNLALIGVRSPKLQKTCADKIPNIEDALQRIFNKNIKVTLQVDSQNQGKKNTIDNLSNSKEDGDSHTNTLPNPEFNLNSTPKPKPSLNNNNNNNSNHSEYKIDHNNYPETPVNKALSPSPKPESEPQLNFQNIPVNLDFTVISNQDSKEYSELEINQITKSFADFFKGEIIDINKHFGKREPEINNDSDLKTIPQESKETKSHSNQRIIINRPDPISFDEDEDIPF